MNSNSENIEDRAFQVLENAGYSEENQIDHASSRLNQNEIVEKMDDASQAAVKKALNEYYSGLKGGEKSKDELAKTFDEQIKDTFKGKESISFDSINRQREALENLVDDPNIQASQVKAYIDDHLTLYKASMKESINTTQKVDGIINAVDKAGLIGGVAYALIGREARSKLRGALGTIGGAGAVGAAVGAVAGAIRGVEKANVKLSNAEINAVTATDSPERIETNDQEGSEAASPNPEKAKQK